MPKKTCEFPGCKTKLRLMRFTCECQKDFCMTHRFPEVHMCSVDYLSKNKDNSEEIQKKLVYLKSRWGEYKKYCVKFPCKDGSMIDIFCISWGGGHGRGQQKKLV